MDRLIFFTHPGFIVIATFLIMEGVAWFAHKYIMHGSMWFFHEDHHAHKPGFFEKNDAFFLIFAVPSAGCFITGSMAGGDFRVWIGAGIAAYGLAYFLVHDVFIHQRFKWFRRTENTYLMAIRKAHKIHHKHLTKEDGECFGMLFVPFRYWIEARNAQSKKRSKSSTIRTK
jgi:beta-carotene 3-hydroxylase